MGKSKAYQWFLESHVVSKEQRIFVRKQYTELKKQYEFWDYLNLVFRKFQKKRCYYCGIKLFGYPTTVFVDKVARNWEIDHKVSIYYGGTNAPFNLCIACKPCNREKGTDLMERSFLGYKSVDKINKIKNNKGLPSKIFF